MKKFRRFVKDRDVNGQSISLKFEKGKDKHYTLLGGCLSLVYYFIMLWYAVTLSIKLVTYGDDRLMIKPFGPNYTPSDKISV